MASLLTAPAAVGVMNRLPGSQDHLSIWPESWEDPGIASLPNQFAVSRAGSEEDLYTLKITAPTTSSPMFAAEGQNIPVSFTFQKGTDPVNHELADIRVTDLTVGGRPCLATTDSFGAAEDVASLPEGIFDAGAAAVGGKVYLVGGKSQSETLDTILEFDPVANTTKVVYNLPVAIRFARAVALDGKVFILGGLDDTNSVVSTIQAYDPILNTLHEVGELREPRYWGAAAVAGDKIYYGGGSYRRQHYDEIFEFDPATGLTRLANTLPRATHIFTATSAYGKVYFIGGLTPGPEFQISDIVEYDPVTNTSTVVATFPPPSGSGGLEAQTAVTLNGKIYIFNGWDESAAPKFRNEIYEFDPLAGEDAVLVGSLPHKVERGAAAAFNGRAYLFGGVDEHLSLNSAITEFIPPGMTAQFNLSQQQWQATCLIPPGLFGSHDLLLRVNYTDHRTNMSITAEDLESNAVVVGGWLPMNPDPRPPARDLHAMAYDSQSDRVILFGGDVGQVVLGDDTWAYNLSANTWTEMTPVLSPSPRWFHTMAYDSESDRVILFGGIVEPQGDGIASNETWAYDYDTNTWSDLNPTVRPPAGGRKPMVYDAESDRVVLLMAERTAQTWTYDFNTNTWTDMTGGIEPPPQGSPAMAYDAESDRTILFWGCSLLACAGPQTWAYDLNTDIWANMTSKSEPTTRTGHRMAYDLESDRVILFGGQQGALRLSDTWSYDYNANTWTEMSPGTDPGARALHDVTYDSEGDRMVLFGGQIGQGHGTPNVNETWIYHHVATPPTAALDIEAIARDGRVTLSWREPMSEGESPITGYRIYRGNSPDLVELLSHVESATPYEDVGVENCRTYYYTVTAVNGVGESRRSDVVRVTPQLTPCAPPNVRAVVSEGQVRLFWASPPAWGADPTTGYRIYRGPSPLALTLNAELGVVHTYLDTTVPDGVTSHYVVTALNALGEGVQSDSVSVVLPDVTAPDVAITSPVQGATLTSTTVTLSGTASDNVEIERVEVSQDGVKWVRASETESWSATLRLTEGPNTIYARATDTSGNQQSVSISISVVVPSGLESLWSFLAPWIVPALATALVGGAVVALLIRRRRIEGG
ncbi:MAG: kelch repeat-containing protein [Thermoplasmata archaeon]